jgi:hypothetical protein
MDLKQLVIESIVNDIKKYDHDRFFSLDSLYDTNVQTIMNEEEFIKMLRNHPNIETTETTYKRLPMIFSHKKQQDISFLPNLDDLIGESFPKITSLEDIKYFEPYVPLAERNKNEIISHESPKFYNYENPPQDFIDTVQFILYNIKRPMLVPELRNYLKDVTIPPSGMKGVFIKWLSKVPNIVKIPRPRPYGVTPGPPDWQFSYQF